MATLFNSVAWSRDGKTLASASDDNTIKLWDVASGTELRTLNAHGKAVKSVVWDSASTNNRKAFISVAWSRDGKMLASASADETIKLWDVTSGIELRTLSGHKDFVTSVSWSSDGKTLTSASADKTIKLWDITSGIELRTLSGHGTTVIRWRGSGWQDTRQWQSG